VVYAVQMYKNKLIFIYYDETLKGIRGLNNRGGKQRATGRQVSTLILTPYRTSRCYSILYSALLHVQTLQQVLVPTNF